MCLCCSEVSYFFIPAAISLKICVIKPISAFCGWSLLFCKQTNKQTEGKFGFEDDLVNRMSAERS